MSIDSTVPKRARIEYTVSSAPPLVPVLSNASVVVCSASSQFPSALNLATIGTGVPVVVTGSNSTVALLTTVQGGAAGDVLSLATDGVTVVWSPASTVTLNEQFIVQTAATSLPSAFSLGSLSSGYVKVTSNGTVGTLSSQVTPIAVSDGGTGVTAVPQYELLMGSGNTTALSLLSPGPSSSTQILGVVNAGPAGYVPTWVPNSSVSISITGDTGTGSPPYTITGSSFTITAGTSTQNCGSTVAFYNSGTTSRLNVSDAFQNTAIGMNAGGTVLVGNSTYFTANTSVGVQALSVLSYSASMAYTSTNNTAVGNLAGGQMVYGNGNTLLGYGAGSNLGQTLNSSPGYNTCIGAASGGSFTSSESYNIVLSSGGDPSQVGVSHTTWIGVQGTQTSVYIAGIHGSTGSGSLVVASSAGKIMQLADSTATTTGTQMLVATNGASGYAVWTAFPLATVGALYRTGTTVSTSQISVGTLPVANGGTGQSTALTQYGVVCASSTTAMACTAAASTTGEQFLVGTSTAVPGWTAFVNSTGGPVIRSTTAAGTYSVGGTVAVAYGGTNLNTCATGDLLYGSGTGVYARLAATTNGDVLTLSGGLPVWAANAAISSIQTDSGTVSGNSILFSGRSGCGKTPEFVGGSGIVQLQLSNNVLGDTLLGATCGGSTNSGGLCTGVGVECLANMNGSAMGNTAFGNNAGPNLTSGSNCTLIGVNAGGSYTTESNNIILCSGISGDPSVAGEVNTMRLGGTTIVSTYIAGINVFIFGIYGATVSSPSIVTMNNMGQMGTTATLKVANGGTNLTTCSTGDLLYGSATGVYSRLTATTNGYVLTLSGGLPSWAASATAVSSITGDSGSAAPSSGVIKVYANTASNATGSSVSFTNSGNTSAFTLSDINHNVMLGYLSGNSSMSGGSNVSIGQTAMAYVTSGASNIALGAAAMEDCSSGNYNVGVGVYSLQRVGSGSQNVALGYNSGSNYTGGESNNILISSLGTAGENNVMRLGTTGTGAGQVSSAYMAGIAGVTVSSAAMVTINTATGQMGSAALPLYSITLVADNSTSVSGSTLTISGGSTGLTTTASGSSVSLTGTLKVANGGTT